MWVWMYVIVCHVFSVKLSSQLVADETLDGTYAFALFKHEKSLCIPVPSSETIYHKPSFYRNPFI